MNNMYENALNKKINSVLRCMKENQSMKLNFQINIIVICFKEKKNNNNSSIMFFVQAEITEEICLVQDEAEGIQRGAALQTLQ